MVEDRTNLRGAIALDEELLQQEAEEREAALEKPKKVAVAGETKPLIDASRVNEIFLACMYGPEELKDGKLTEDKLAVLAEGIVCTIGFHPGRLESHRKEVRGMLEGLPLEFRRTVGDGWSFLNACNDRNGVQWTGLHQRMEQLFQLGIGLGLAKCLVPREMWSMLPGGMPYYSVL